MTRKHIDCFEVDGVFEDCTVSISAERDEELLEAAVEHAVTAHRQQDTPQLRERLKHAMHEAWRTY